MPIIPNLAHSSKNVAWSPRCVKKYNDALFWGPIPKIGFFKNVFIFGHGNANKCMLMNLLNLPPEFYNDFPKATNSSIININNGKFIPFDF